MRKFEITQEQILELTKGSRYYNSDRLEEWFPEAFETKLEVGKWYSYKDNTLDWLMNYQGDGVGYGFNTSRIYGINYRMDRGENWQEATPQEVRNALVQEAVKRGYKKGVFCEFGIVKDIREIKSNFPVYKEHRNGLYVENDEIFVNGKWSPIILKTISKEEAEKILNKKIV